MCGICGGVICPKVSKVMDLETLRRMSGMLVHRGPDQDGFYLSKDKKTGLGFRRLSIIDLSGGNQPISNEDGLIHVVFNGEIYNFQELRSVLEKQGHIFSTHSDTEVIVHAYEQYGIDCVQHLHGMFAFALWDSARQKLFLARDRLGKKPLYYWSGPDGLYFASELKALLQIPKMPRDVDQDALAAYFRYQYVPAPRSILQGVYKLPPAHTLVFDSEQNSLDISSYWQPEYEPKLHLSMREAEEELLEELRRAVRQRLISDVPLGALLSGGIDSSLIVALMAESGPQVKTFTIGFEESRFDERPYARMVAQRYETDHQELVVHPDMLDVLPRLAWYLDEPMADPSALPTYYVSQMAHQHVTVVLNGDGGDENFGGYWHHTASLSAQQLSILPSWLRNGFLHQLRWSSKRFPEISLLTRLSRFLEQGDWPLWRMHESRMTLFDTRSLYSLLPQLTDRSYESYFERIYSGLSGLKKVDALLRADLLAVLPGQLLVKMDRMSMANSLETRSPLLDHKVVELVARFPINYKIAYGKKKILLRHLAARFIPDSLVRRPKMGFAVPLPRWLYREYAAPIRDILQNPQACIYKYVNFNAVKQLLECATVEQSVNSQRIWALLVLEEWLQGVLN
jgi:asparagine synthase (glutamine-hydrolysing)